MIFYVAGSNRPELLRIVAQTGLRLGILQSYGDTTVKAKGPAALRVIKAIVESRRADSTR